MTITWDIISVGSIVGMSVSLSLWWWSKAPSVGLALLILTSILGAVFLNTSVDCLFQTLLLLITMVGGLFILISMVILSQAKDLDYSNLKMKGGHLMILSLILVSSLKKEEVCVSSSVDIFASIFGPYVLSFILLIFVLLISLKLINSLMNLSKKKFF